MQFLSIIQGFFSIIFWFIVILIPLVVVHEFGHLLLARLFRVRIPEFGIGMPLTRHRLFKSYKGIVWSIYPWLLGGFVRIYGDHDALDEAFETNKENPQKARDEYQINRLQEIIQTQELAYFLKENSIDFDVAWNWFDNVSLINKKQLTINDYVKCLKYGMELPKFLTQSNFWPLLNQSDTKNIEASVNELTETEKNELNSFFEKKYQEKKETLLTLIDWEFDAKISSSNKRAVKNAFFAKNWIQQTLIISGGVLFNMIASVFILSILFGFFGSIPMTRKIDGSFIFYEQINEWRKQSQVELLSNNLIVSGIAKDSPADKAGLSGGDELIKIGNDNLQQVNSFEGFKDIVNKYKDQTVELKYIESEDKQEKTSLISPQTVDGKARLGISTGYLASRKAQNPIQAISLGWSETGEIFNLTLNGLRDLIVVPFSQDKSALDNAGGPIAVGWVGSRIFDVQGVRGILYLTAAISVSLAVFNMLPIPALDGGRFVILTLSKIFGKRNKKLEAIAISATFFLLIGLAVLIAGNDIRRILTGSI
jgi:membrane-associated protease RseP (regulator of RpoE activity)